MAVSEMTPSTERIVKIRKFNSVAVDDPAKVPQGRSDISPLAAAELSFYHSLTGVIYFLNAEGTDFWKVGFCKKESAIVRRMSELQTGCPHRLRLVAVKKHTTPCYEHKIHCLMERYRMCGEWFIFNPWLEDFMDGWKVPI